MQTIVSADEPFWRIILDVSIAVGTAAAAAAAWWAARTAGKASKSASDIAEADRREADRRAHEDRAAAAERDSLRRRYDNLRHRLDHLVGIAEALEAYQSARTAMWPNDAMAKRETERAASVLRARLGAAADLMLAVEAVLDRSKLTPAWANGIYHKYADLLPEEARHQAVAQLRQGDPIVPARAEIYGKIRDVRLEMLRDQVESS
ncbi:MAG: hypothetical protein GEV03_28140 [Streptosporangiales bacterium]|nr:hypothetical protein [Streptosporangiales bacterium]